jgi:metallo-beta-lactamase family protein
MQLEFFGAAGEVTGSCHILRVGGAQLLLDCGMVQGGRDAPARNRQAFPFEAAGIDAVVLSHAHVDHCGRLPLLVKRGFRGPIYTNRACAELMAILLEDSADLLARETERANRDVARDRRAEPLFDPQDVAHTLRLVEPIAYDTPVKVLPGAEVRVRDAGHILGSSSVELTVSEAQVSRRIVFSGDLGQYDTPILKDPWRFESADLVLMESTYGDRLHRRLDDTERELGGILAQAARDGGNVLIPAFAIGRSQEILYLLARH